MVVVELLVEGDVWTRGWVELLIPQDDVMKEKLANLQKWKPLQSNIYSWTSANAGVAQTEEDLSWGQESCTA